MVEKLFINFQKFRGQDQSLISHLTKDSHQSKKEWEQKAKEDAERNNVPLPSAYYEEHILKVTEENTMPSDLQPPKPFIYSRISFTEDSITAAVRSPCGRFDLLT